MTKVLILAALAAVAVGQTPAAQPTHRLTLELADFAPMPITGELKGQNTRGQLARVNFLRDEPGGGRFFVNDLNGPLYILDKKTKTFTTYLDFNGAGGRPGLFPKFTFERNLAIGLTNFLLREHTSTSTVSENGRYRIPNDNPFSGVEGARKEIWASGLRNPHRLIWDVDPARPKAPVLFAFNIGLATWETVVIVRKGANYGYSLREGTQMMSPDGMSAVPEDDTIPIQISDTVVRGTVKPTYPSFSTHT